MTRSSTTIRFSLLFLLVITLSFLVVGCGRKGGQQDITPPDVITDRVKQDDVQLYIYVTGQTVPYKLVDITARVPGYLKEVYFEQGKIVNENDKLALIEQDQYKIAIDIAKAELEVNKAQEKLRKANLERSKQLLESGANTQEEYQSREAEYQMIVATIAKSEAALEKAKLDLSYTELTAPIPGKTTKRKVDVGNYVGVTPTSLLTIVQMDPLYVDFGLSDQTILDFKERMGFHRFYQLAIQLREAGEHDSRAITPEGKPATDRELSVLPSIGGDTPQADRPVFEISPISTAEMMSGDFPFRGEIVSVLDNQISTSTGQVILRGVLPNPLLNTETGTDYLLYPGQNCRVRIPYEKVRNAILVREEAVLTDLDTKYLLVVKEGEFTPKTPFGTTLKDEDGNVLVKRGMVVHRRDIVIDRLLDNQMRIVLSGIEPGEEYIVQGVQRARIGSAVTPIDFAEFMAERTQSNSEQPETKEEPENVKEN